MIKFLAINNLLNGTPSKHFGLVTLRYPYLVREVVILQQTIFIEGLFKQ